MNAKAIQEINVLVIAIDITNKSKPKADMTNPSLVISQFFFDKVIIVDKRATPIVISVNRTGAARLPQASGAPDT